VHGVEITEFLRLVEDFLLFYSSILISKPLRDCLSLILNGEIGSKKTSFYYSSLPSFALIFERFSYSILLFECSLVS